KPPSWIP
nr:tryptophyllin, basic - Rohde's leaf frog [Pithecopus rohdei]